MPMPPICAQDERTSNVDATSFLFAGVPQSKRTRTTLSCRQTLFRAFEHGQRLLPFHPRKPLQDLINCRTEFEILE